MENKLVVAVVVTFNRKELLKESIEAHLKSSYKNVKVLIVDNASTDGTHEYIENLIDNEKVLYVNTGANLGGAGGFNFGMKEAYKLNADYMWLMDDDCIVHEDSLMNLMNAESHLPEKYGFLSSKVLWKDNSICKMNIQKSSLKNKITDWETDYQKIIMATFVSFLVKTEVVKEVGLPISDFFIWADDIEYARRISKKYPCYLITSSVVTHKSKQNIGSNIVEDSVDNLKRYGFAYRNEMYVFRREGLYGKLYYKLKVAYHKLKIKRSNNSSEDKLKKIEVINSAVSEGKKFFPSIEMLD